MVINESMTAVEIKQLDCRKCGSKNYEVGFSIDELVIFLRCAKCKSSETSLVFHADKFYNGTPWFFEDIPKT